MRILSIDFGTARVGLALSDELKMLASPLMMIPYSSGIVEEIAAIVRQRGVELVVLGMPYALDGSETPSTRRVKSFAERLRSALSCSLVEWDESLSTRRASERMLDAGVRKKKRTRKGTVDAWAAAIILQEYLDATSSGR